MIATTAAHKRTQWLLVALAKAGDRGLTAVQMQKVLFLLGERRKSSVGRYFYEFEPYNYGPFSRDVYDDADRLLIDGAVELDTSGGRSLRTYRLTERGKEFALAAERDLPPEGVAYLAEVVPWVQSKTFTQLVRAIYEAYPAMRENSVFQES